ncbi:MAG: GNAT family N-acetyltransferase [Burkholderiaceae bacterium]|nr:GNAT family N-acetyltransferase [Burkholderiaceae bacterium]
MAEQRLLISADPTCDSIGLSRSLFQSRAFFELHAGDRGVYFEWAHGQRVVASIHFTPLPDGLWRSPARGTYAGFALEPGVSQEDLGAFHDAASQSLIDRGARQIEILPAPMAHDPVAFTNQVYLLRSRGYAISQCDLNHSMVITDQSLTERMTYGNLKRLRKCEREGLLTEQLPLQDLAAVYEVIEANRLAKGHAMSMSLPQLQTMAERFPDAFVLFGSRDGARLAAAALCLRLGDGVLYVFYWGDQPGYATLSPVVGIADAVYRYGQQEGMRLLDVGTSTVDCEPHHGLIQFKRGLGFSESLKLRLLKAL